MPGFLLDIWLGFIWPSVLSYYGWVMPMVILAAIGMLISLKLLGRN